LQNIFSLQGIYTNSAMNKRNPHPNPVSTAWIPLTTSAVFIVKKPLLLGWSLFLVLATIALTWLGFQLTTGFFDNLTKTFFTAAPATESIWGWIKYGGWQTSKWLFLLVSRILAFYLAFLTAYSLSAPLYAFLSTAAEKLYSGDAFELDDGFSVKGVLRDLLEGIKIGLFGVVVTMIALVIGFIPVIGQISVFLLYTYYSALMFLDYPSSRRRWSLGQKISWIRRHGNQSFRLGVVPAAVSMIPILNVFLMALVFPLFTVHSTLNFYTIEKNRQPVPTSGNPKPKR
jgi:CysZ protein